MNTPWLTRAAPLWFALACAACGADDDSSPPDPPWVDGFEHRFVVELTTDPAACRAPLRLVDRLAGDPALARVLTTHAIELAPLLPGSRRLRNLYRGTATTDRDQAFAAVRDLAALDHVARVYLEPLGLPPPGDIAPATPSYVESQSYRGAAGIDVDYAVSVGATGAGVRLADVEYGWDPAHEDLVDRDLHLEAGQTIAQLVYDNGYDRHGTGALGVSAAVANGYGMTGLTPDAEVFTFPEYTNEEGSRRVAAIAAAAANARAGDVILLEMQSSAGGGQYVPAEYDYGVWQVIKAATDAGIVVVAAAGNGSQDLDGPLYDEYRSRGDSGAIIVGAGSPGGHDPLFFTSFGSPVDVQGWGEAVATLGYGDLASVGGDTHQTYTAGFNGTSSASAMVAGVAVVVQSYAMTQLGRRLSPGELRDLLIDTGVPQANPAMHIGPLPSLRAALDDLRDNPPPPSPLLIDELLADPPAGFDASGDGVAGGGAEQFVELANLGTAPLDLSGATIATSAGVQVTLPSGTSLAPGGVLVVFGGAALGAAPAGVTFLSPGPLALAPTGDTVTISHAGVLLATVTYGAGANSDQSLVRMVELEPAAALVGHVSIACLPASPGRRSDGTAF